jgi:glycosyltransferase involved in cell wall biosynthesis
MSKPTKKNRLLTVCIPTYRRPHSVMKAVSSVLTQIDMFSLQKKVNLIVADDFSGDSTHGILQEIHHDSFSFCRRPQNLGMSRNLYGMITDITSQYILILTDDDWLQAKALRDVIEILENFDNDKDPPGMIWTPRYSYLESGELYCIETDPYKHTRRIKPGAFSSARNARNGFILSGLIIRREAIAMETWERNSENGYFPVLIAGEIMVKWTTVFWKRNIVHHTVLNKTHWHRWGSSTVAQQLRLHCDFLRAFDVLSKQLGTRYEKWIFNAVSILPRALNIGSYLKNEYGYHALSLQGKQNLNQIYIECYINSAAIIVVLMQYSIRLVKRIALTCVGKKKSTAVERRVLSDGFNVVFDRGLTNFSAKH